MNTSAISTTPELGPTSVDLVQRAGQDDAGSWRELVLLYGPVVRYWIRRRGVSGCDETDVFHDVFVAVQRQLPQFKHGEDAAKFRARLKTVAIGKIADFHLRPQPFGGAPAWQVIPELPAEFYAAADAVLAAPDDKPPTRQALQIIRAEFSAQEWQAFWRTAIEGCTATAAADELALTPAAVRTARSTVLATLRDYLNGLGES